MRWRLTNSVDPQGRALADRHYSRQKIGSRRFILPGRCLVLVTEDGNAVWCTSWPFARYVRHAWAGAWMNSIFRNESKHLSSDLIIEAIAATRALWSPPPLGLVTFIDTDKTKPKKHPGYCYRVAGFKEVGTTEGGLVALQMLPLEMPEAQMPLGVTQDDIERFRLSASKGL